MPKHGLKLAEFLDALRHEVQHGAPFEVPPGSNRTKYGRAYGLDGYAWCLIFLWAIWNAVAGKVPWKSAYTPWMQQWFIDQGRWGREPRKGAFVFFNFYDSLDRTQHVGVVIDFTATTITTIEGNTSSGTGGSQDDGGGVYRRTRQRDGQIVGYGYPPYVGAAGHKKDAPAPPSPQFLGRGSKGADVKNLQRDLNRLRFGFKKGTNERPMWDELEVDGEFGRSTVNAVLAWQKWQGLDLDGRVGSHDLARIEKARDRQQKAASRG